MMNFIFVYTLLISSILITILYILETGMSEDAWKKFYKAEIELDCVQVLSNDFDNKS